MTLAHDGGPDNAPAERRRWMSLLAQADAGDLALVWDRLPPPPSYQLLRRPEIGLVMVRGRTGGDGAPFNLGEMTVTRCSVRLHTGAVGHAWVAGRSNRHAEQAAVIDALMHDPDRRPALEPELAWLAQRRSTARDLAARKAAATKVDFFTMVRGE